MNIKGKIPDEIYDDCMKWRQQMKLSYELMLQPSEYLDYIHCDLDSSYLTTRRGNRCSF